MDSTLTLATGERYTIHDGEQSATPKREYSQPDGPGGRTIEITVGVHRRFVLHGTCPIGSMDRLVALYREPTTGTLETRSNGTTMTFNLPPLSLAGWSSGGELAHFTLEAAGLEYLYEAVVTELPYGIGVPR